MSTARDRGRPAVFVQQLHRAAAQRGKLDPVYQDLSDHWTAILQRLYPVWALIGPGLSDPGRIEIHSRTIYLDSDTLLGTRGQIVAGRLERRAVLRCFGVALHETFHGKHTKRWAIDRDVALSESEDPVERQLAIDRRLLEEPRMEAHGVREHPDGTLRGRFVRHALQAAVTDVILPAFAEHLLAEAIGGTPLTRDMAGRATVYLQARTHYGIVDPAVLNGLRDRWRQVLGDRDMHRLEQLFARLVWIPDGELDALDHAAREYRTIIGPPDPAASEPRDQTSGGDAGSGGSKRRPAAGSLGEALEQALRSAREGQLEQLDADLDLQQVLANAAAEPGQGSPSRSRRGTG
ncbi:MAG TPA: hypothetical protein VMF07_16140, partial [Solirubrobacteraceae bacterium]|nr:hypothetical protein [Solirubrobacteraceae bacterium]